jgi:hypothetical protein
MVIIVPPSWLLQREDSNRPHKLCHPKALHEAWEGAGSGIMETLRQGARCVSVYVGQEVLVTNEGHVGHMIATWVATGWCDVVGTLASWADQGVDGINRDTFATKVLVQTRSRLRLTTDLAPVLVERFDRLWSLRKVPRAKALDCVPLA